MTQPWDLPEREATPPDVALSRRRWLKLMVPGAIGAIAAGAGYWWLVDDPSDQRTRVRERPEPARCRPEDLLLPRPASTGR